MKLLGVLASAVLTAPLAGGLALGGAGASAAAQPVATPPGSVVVRGAAGPTLTPIGRTGLLVTAVHTHGTLTARVAKGAATGAPVWGHPIALGRVDQRYAAQVALNRRGAGAVAWTAKDGPRFGVRSLVRLRSASGTWTKPYRVPGSTGPVYSAAVNKRGTVAVAAYSSSSSYSTVLAIHRHGRGWQIRHLTDFPDGPASVAVAPDDSVYLAAPFVLRGAYGSTAHLVRISPRGRMTRTQLPDDRVESVQVLATPDGHIDLVLGQAQVGRDEWESTADGETYWANHYVVRSRLGAKGPWKSLWDGDGVVDPQATLNGDDVRLTWTQYADPISNNTDDHTFGNAPQRLELRTLDIGPSQSDRDGTLLASQSTGLPTTFGGPFIGSSTAAAGRCLVVAWRTGMPAQPSPLSSSFGGITRTWPDRGRGTSYETAPEAATACVAGHGYIARTADQVVRHGVAVGGRVRVESLD